MPFTYLTVNGSTEVETKIFSTQYQTVFQIPEW